MVYVFFCPVVFYLLITFEIVNMSANTSLPLCSFCEEMPTHHRCMHLVGGSIAFGRICGALICSLCSVELGNEEGIFRCERHSGNPNEPEDDLANKENFDKEEDRNSKSREEDPNSKRDAAPMKKKGKVTGKNVKSSEYSAKDLLVLSQAFIRVSENAVEGVSRKQGKFWDDVAEAYKELKTQQEAYDSRQRKKLKYNAVILRGQEMMDDDDDDDNVIITARTSSSLQQKWSKFVLPLVTKFCSLAQRYPMSSGEGKLLLFFFSLFTFSILTLLFVIVSDEDRHYHRLHMIFLKQSPGVSSFDLYRPAWEFLKDSQKFISTTRTLANSSIGGNAEVTPAPDSTNTKRPAGSKAAKRKIEEEKIVENVKDSLKGTLLPKGSSTNSSSSALLATAFSHFADMLHTGIQKWTERAAYCNADPEVKRRFDNLVLLQRIKEMEATSDAKSFQDAVMAEGGEKGGPTTQVSTQSVELDTDESSLLQNLPFNKNNNVTETPEVDLSQAVWARKNRRILFARQRNLLGGNDTEVSQIITYGDDYDDSLNV